MSNTLVDVGEALNGVAKLIADPEVLLAITSHLTAREVIVIADLFEAAGDHATYCHMMEGIIHGEDEVRAVAVPDRAGGGSGSFRVEYFADFPDWAAEDEPFYVRTFRTGGLRAAMKELDLEVDSAHGERTDAATPGRLVLCSGVRG